MEKQDIERIFNSNMLSKNKFKGVFTEKEILPSLVDGEGFIFYIHTINDGHWIALFLWDGILTIFDPIKSKSKHYLKKLKTLMSKEYSRIKILSGFQSKLSNLCGYHSVSILLSFFDNKKINSYYLNSKSELALKMNLDSIYPLLKYIIYKESP